MATPPKPNGPPNAPLFDETGVMSKVWVWYFYQVFTSAAGLTDVQVLQAFDSAGDSAAIAAAEDAGRVAIILDDPPLVLPADLEELRRRIVGLNENAVDPRPLDDLAKLLFAWTGDTPPRVVLTGTNALRLLTPAADGAVFFETDTLLLFIAVNGVWVAVSGAAPGAWTAYTPVITPSGAMTFTGLTINARYQQSGKTVFVRAKVAGTVGGVLSNNIGIALPVAQKDDDQTLATAIIQPGFVFRAGMGVFSAALGLLIFNYDNSNYPAGAVSVYMEGSYEAA